MIPEAQSYAHIPICSYVSLPESPFLSPLNEKRPFEILKIVEIVDKEILLIDLNYNYHKISIDSAAIKCAMLAAAGEIQLALKWASAVPSKWHTEISKLFLSLGFLKESIQLPALDVQFIVCFLNFLHSFSKA